MMPLTDTFRCVSISGILDDLAVCAAWLGGLWRAHAARAVEHFA
jgi:hypothetical protein